MGGAGGAPPPEEGGTALSFSFTPTHDLTKDKNRHDAEVLVPERALILIITSLQVQKKNKEIINETSGLSSSIPRF